MNSSAKRDYSEATLTDAWWSEVFDCQVTMGQPSRIGDGLVGMNLRVPLQSSSTAVPASVVVKLASTDPTSRTTGMSLRNYEREVKFYEQIAPTVDICVPKCFFSDWNEETGEFVLVLEDMAPAAQGNQITGCSVGHAEAAIDELVNLHGPRWDDATLWDNDWIQRRTSDDDAQQLLMIYSLMKDGFLNTFGDSVRATCGDKGIDLVNDFPSLLLKYVNEREQPFTVVHGDYRLDNMLFATPQGGARCAVVDWQTPGHGTGMSDLAYFIGAGLVVDDRRAHEDALVNRYIAGLQARSIDVSADWVHRHYRREAIAGVIMSVVASQIVQRTERGDQMFMAMATRHIQHALDSDTLSLI